MEYKLCLDSKEMKLIHDALSFCINEGTLFMTYSIEEFVSLLFVLNDSDPVDFQKALNYAIDLVGYDVASSLSKEVIIKLYDSR